jgi:lipopolysaccharide transport system permease protein
MNAQITERWTSIIRPATGWFDLRLADLWRYRDLIMLFVKRDFITVYSQTILGPLWYLLQPLLTTAVFVVVFGHITRVPTEGLPMVLFYLLGTVTWNYFSACLVKTSTTFTSNAQMFGKIYFPRLVIPVSVVVSNFVSFAIQFSLYLLVFLFFFLKGEAVITFRLSMLLLPLLVLQMAALGLGCGIIVSALTTRYRDLAQLVGFGVQLWMFVTPVVYPASVIPVQWKWILLLNPMAMTIETFRYSLHGVGNFQGMELAVSFLMTAFVCAIGVMLFSRIEKTFTDTV